jgi:lipoprotein-releasing system permease protein
MLSVELFIAIKYLNSKNKSFASKLVIYLTAFSIAIGVSTLIISLSVMSGFQRDIRNRIIGSQPHMTITSLNSCFTNYFIVQKKIQKNKTVQNVIPFISKQALVTNSNLDYTTLITLKALNYNKNLTTNSSKIPNIIIGKELAKNLSVNVGDKVQIILIHDNFKTCYCNISSIVTFGQYMLDSYLCLINLQQGQRMFEMDNKINGFDIYLTNYNKAQTAKKQIQEILPSLYNITTWIETNKQLFSALKIEKIMMTIILGFIIFVASFNITSNLIMSSIQKTKDIGIMSALGFSRWSISKIFFLEGIIIGSFGIIIGVILGIIISLLLKYIHIVSLPNDIYFIDNLPICLIPVDIVLVTISTFVIIVISSLYPSYYVSKLDPLNAIKNG